MKQKKKKKVVAKQSAQPQSRAAKIYDMLTKAEENHFISQVVQGKKKNIPSS